MKRFLFAITLTAILAVPTLALAPQAGATEDTGSAANPTGECRSSNNLDTGFVIADGPLWMGSLEFPAHAVGPFVVHNRTTNNIPEKGDRAYHTATVSGAGNSFAVEREGQPNVHVQEATTMEMPSGKFMVSSPDGLSAQFEVWATCEWEPRLTAEITSAVIQCLPEDGGTQRFALSSTVASNGLDMGTPNVADGAVENVAFELQIPFTDNYGNPGVAPFNVAKAEDCANTPEPVVQLTCTIERVAQVPGETTFAAKLASETPPTAVSGWSWSIDGIPTTAGVTNDGHIVVDTSTMAPGDYPVAGSITITETAEELQCSPANLKIGAIVPGTPQGDAEDIASIAFILTIVAAVAATIGVGIGTAARKGVFSM